jgi:Ca2+-binding RTX toxin-like protein
MFEFLETRRLLDATVDASGNLNINGSAAADTINLALEGTNLRVTIQPENFNQTFPAGNVNFVVIVAGAGADTVTVNAAVTENTQVQAGAGNDTVTGGGGADDIRGEDGDDLIDGGLGGDSLAGDTGIDTVTYNSRTVPLNLTFDDVQNDGATGENDQLNATVDIVIGGTGADTISAVGQTEGRALYGRNGDDTLIGGAGADRLNAGVGTDSLDAHAGDDTLLSGTGNDALAGGAGIDTVTYYYSPAAVTVNLSGLGAGNGAASEQDTLGDVENAIGSPFADTISGSPAVVNFLKGLAGDDTITALGGNDTLWGGNGVDQLLAMNGAVDVVDGGNGLDTGTTDPTDDVTNLSDDSGGGGTGTGK